VADPTETAPPTEAQTRAHLKVAKRLIRIKKAKDDLIEFARLMMPHDDDPDDADLSGYDAQLHHRCIADALQKVEKGEMLRLIITMPPGSGKSQLSAKYYIPWLEGRDPARHTIFATYNDTFAEDTGRAVRDVMQSTVYKQIFPKTALKKGSAAADRVETKKNGLMAFVGIGGSITGRRANVGIVDDPIKDREQANSETERNKIWNWFTQVFMTRLKTDMSAVIIIMTRWHEDDIVGRLTDPNNEHYRPNIAKKWKILKLQAIAGADDPLGREEGESIWPSRFSKAYLEEAREMDSSGFSALFQGDPTPNDGDFFKDSWLHGYTPEDLIDLPLRKYCASDHAVSTKQKRDKTCMGPIGVDPDGIIYVLPDVWWRKATSDVVAEAMLNLMRMHDPIFWWAENGHISQAIGPFLRKRMIEENVFCSIVEKTPIKDKETRAQAIQGRMAMGRVRFPTFAPWWEAAKAELLKFPYGTNDDFVDFLSWVGIGLGQMHSASREPKKRDTQPKSGTLAWIKMSSNHAQTKRLMAARGGF